MSESKSVSIYGPLLVVIAVAFLVFLLFIDVRRFERKIRATHASQDKRVQEILMTGIPVRAEILSISDTGIRMQPHHIYAQVRFQIQPAHGDTYEIATRISVPVLRISELVPGKEISARIDALTQEVAIEYEKFY